MSKEKKVVTIKGEEHPISKCRKFEKGYYLIGQVDVLDSGDCYLIDDKYYRIETEQVVFNYEINQYVLKNNLLKSGIIGFNDKDVKFGYFSPSNKNVDVYLENGNKSIILNEELLKNQKQYRERLSDGCYYHTDLLSAIEFNKIKLPTNDYKTSLPYDSGAVLKSYVENYNNLEVLINSNVKNVTPLVKNLTFGLEFETIAGFLPNRILNTTGLIPLRDGSISGIEYVTVPVQGEKGLQTIVNASQALEKRTKYDKSCALHLHIGNVPRTPEFILAMLKFTCAIQDEMYSMFPLYKKYNFKVKNKNYSKPYPVFQLLSQLDPVITSANINKNFEVLYQYLSMGERFRDRDNNLKNVYVHPADRENRAKWQIKTRYYLINMIPLIFGNKQTIEFRIHTATFDTNKIMLFTLLNALCVNFVIKHTTNILQDPMFLVNHGKLVTVLKNEITSSEIKSPSFKNYISKRLEEYIQLRKNITEENNCSGDIIGHEDTIKVSKPIDWLKVLDPSKLEHYTNLKTKYDLEVKQFKDAFDISKRKVIEDHLKGIISTYEGQTKLNQLEQVYLKNIEDLKSKTPELIEILNETEW